MHNDYSHVSPNGSVGRRRLIGAGLTGAAASLLPLLAGRVSAGSTPPDDTEPAPTTTAPPKRPTESDIAVLGFSQGVELAARDLYDIGLGAADLSDLHRTVLVTIRESHEAYAQALSGLLGRLADGATNADVVDQLTASFSGSAESVLQAAYDLESALVTTHADALGDIQGVDAAKLLASVLVTEARHSTVLADLTGNATLDDLLVTDKADALTPAEG